MLRRRLLVPLALTAVLGSSAASAFALPAGSHHALATAVGLGPLTAPPAGATPSSLRASVQALDVTSPVSIPVGGSPRTVAISPDGKHAYVTNYSNLTTPGTVSVIDTASNTVLGEPIPVGEHPRTVAISPDGKHAYIANVLSGTVSVLETSSNQVR